MNNTIALLLVIAGAIFLVGGLAATRQILRQTPRKLSWGFLLVLITLFIIGYSAFGYQLIAQPMSQVLFIVALVFLGGGAFVLVISRLSLATISEAKKIALLEAEKLAIKAENSAIRVMQSRLELILDNVGEGIFVLDEKGVIEVFNPAAEFLFGYPESEILGRHIGLLIPSVENKPGVRSDNPVKDEISRLTGRESEVSARHRNGTQFPMALKLESLVLDGRTLYTGLMADISERKAMLDRLKAMAERDGLTGLYNRTFFVEELRQLVQRIRRSKQIAALLHIDLDHFKYVNDTLGHAAGDRVLIDVGHLLTKRMRKTDLIGRLGGDEFIVLLYDADPSYAYEIAESFRDAMSSYRYVQDSNFVDVGCSIGVALIDESCESEAEALFHADGACHLAKRSGRNRIHVFEQTDEREATTVILDMGWSHRINEALSSNKFTLFCQPIVALQNGQVAMHEVFIRMNDGDEKFISPGGFLPFAERFGLSVDIDKWVIVHAIANLIEQRKTAPDMRYAINLSGPSLSDDSVYRLIAERIASNALDPSALAFEITESVAMCDMVAAENFLSKLQRLGCKTTLDDFGSGFSSFSYLKNMPVDYVKIDGSFIKNLATSRIDHAMIKSINEIAHVLGKETIAEFAESEVIVRSLRDHGIDYAQGHYFGRPEPIQITKSEWVIPNQSQR